MLIPRKLSEKLSNSLKPKKVLMLVGPRQVGKTSLIKQCLDGIQGEKRMDLNGDFLADREILLKKSKIEFENLIGDSSLLFIDEAQKFENINLNINVNIFMNIFIKTMFEIHNPNSSFIIFNKIII
jgi:predicted AAA+ superfamily ATPase